MDETTIRAVERHGKPNKVRSEGFAPGVLNGPGTASAMVQFDPLALSRVITKHGPNAKVWVEYGAEKSFGFIKEIQKQPVEGKILHVAVQLVSKDQEVKMHLPITFHGIGEMEHRMLKVQVYKSEAEVFGKAELLPDSIVVDVSGKELGAEITAGDFCLPPDIKIADAVGEIYAVIKPTSVAYDEPQEV